MDLRLLAEDSEDLDIIAAHLQDAVMQVRDLAWLPSRRRFALVVNRFRWEGEGKTRRNTHERARTGLHFDNVLRARVKHINRDKPDGVLSLLTLSFRETDAPSGVVTMTFSGGAEIELDVEALDVQLSDLGLSWPTQNRPAHEVGQE